MKNVFKITHARFALFCATFLLVGIWSSAPGAEKIIIGFSQATMNSAWRIAMADGNKKYAAEHYPDVELIFTDGQNQAAKQVSDVSSLMTQGIKVLINSGGAAGSGSGSNPMSPQDAQEAKPTEPDKAEDSKSGEKSTPG